MFRFFCTLLFSFSLVGCVGPPNQQDIQSTQHEKATPKESFFHALPDEILPFVGSLRKEDGKLIGSGVLIRKNVVITAGHCISPKLSYVEFGSELIAIKCVEIHPEYEINGKIVNDIAVIVLEADSSYQPVKIVENISDVEIGSPLTTVGFSSNFKKMSIPGTFYYYGILMHEPEEFKFLPLKDTIWFGDSGGAVLVVRDDEFYLMGIITHFSVKDGLIYENSAHRVDFYIEWLYNVINNYAFS